MSIWEFIIVSAIGGFIGLFIGSLVWKVILYFFEERLEARWTRQFQKEWARKGK